MLLLRQSLTPSDFENFSREDFRFLDTMVLGLRSGHLFAATTHAAPTYHPLCTRTNSRAQLAPENLIRSRILGRDLPMMHAGAALAAPYGTIPA